MAHFIATYIKNTNLSANSNSGVITNDSSLEYIIIVQCTVYNAHWGNTQCTANIVFMYDKLLKKNFVFILWSLIYWMFGYNAWHVLHIKDDPYTGAGHGTGGVSVPRMVPTHIAYVWANHFGTGIGKSIAIPVRVTSPVQSLHLLLQRVCGQPSQKRHHCAWHEWISLVVI